MQIATEKGFRVDEMRADEMRVDKMKAESVEAGHCGDLLAAVVVPLFYSMCECEGNCGKPRETT